jgi:starvation-inducible outer membrane lipoprotein
VPPIYEERNVKKIIVALAVLMLAGCEPTPDSLQSDRADKISYQTNTRFKVERVSVFYDGLAYGDKRGIYIITDTETRQEFIGVSGVGISELASHQSGKTRLSDER